MSLLRIGSCLITAMFLATASCGDDKPAVDDPDGKAECDELGELCHEAGEIDAAAAECHEVGHTGDPTACAARYDECKALCEMILASAGGAGGAGGASNSSGGAPASTAGAGGAN